MELIIIIILILIVLCFLSSATSAEGFADGAFIQMAAKGPEDTYLSDDVAKYVPMYDTEEYVWDNQTRPLDYYYPYYPYPYDADVVYDVDSPTWSPVEAVNLY